MGEYVEASHSGASIPEKLRAVEAGHATPLVRQILEGLKLRESILESDDATGIKVRELLDALDEKFHGKGGLKYLYSLFPGGPVAQGCRIAGLQAPAGSTDMGFGSVQ